MAIVEMKRMTLLGMTASREKLLRALQRAGCVEITELDADTLSYQSKDRRALDDVEERLGRIRWAIGQLGRYETKQGMLASMSMPTVDEETAEQVAADEPALMQVVQALEAVERRSGELKGQEARLRVQIEQLLPWRQLDVPVERIAETRDTVQFVGTINNRNYPALLEALRDLPVSVEHVGDERDAMFLWLVAYRAARPEVQAALKAADFSAVQFAGETGTVAQLIDNIRAQLSGMQAERDKLEGEQRTLASELPRLKILYEHVAAERERALAASQFAETGSTFLMQGWIPARACEKMERKLRAISPDVALEWRDPLPEEQPPTLLHNNRVIAPFEAVVANYSLPDPRGLDPTFIMAPFFACFFGMMVSDAGYGLIMAVAIPLIIHFIKPKTGLRKIMWILAIGGMFTVFWGAMFDTWFGASVKPMLLNPLEQPIEMMVLCIGMGAIHLFTGLGVGAYMNFKRGKPLDAIFDQFLWVFMIVGLPMLLLPQLATLGAIFSIGGAVGIVLTAGRAKPTILGKLTGGFGALYNVTSWLSDLLSYMRLFGMGLATGVIGMVINMLVGLMFGKNIIFTLFGVVILIGGHVFNAAINVLGAYVHACRLQYIEFFGKFYEDGGRPFTPLSENPRYVSIVDSNADGVEQ